MLLGRTLGEVVQVYMVSTFEIDLKVRSSNKIEMIFNFFLILKGLLYFRYYIIQLSRYKTCSFLDIITGLKNGKTEENIMGKTP